MLCSREGGVWIIIMYIYHVLIKALSAHMIQINLNMIFYTHVEHSPTNSISMVLHHTLELLKANQQVRAFPVIAESKCVWTALACSSCSCTLGLLWTSPPNTCRWSPLWGSCAFTALACGTILWLWSWPSSSCSLSQPCWCRSTPPARLWPSPVWPR